jgi:hypothetical protein
MKSEANHHDLLHSHVWGCLAIVLEPKLQNDQKLPKWNWRACVGQFLGYLDEHSLLVALCNTCPRVMFPHNFMLYLMISLW